MRRLQTLQAVIGIVVVDYRVYRLIKPVRVLSTSPRLSLYTQADAGSSGRIVPG